VSDKELVLLSVLLLEEAGDVPDVRLDEAWDVDVLAHVVEFGEAPGELDAQFLCVVVEDGFNAFHLHLDTARDAFLLFEAGERVEYFGKIHWFFRRHGDHSLLMG